MADRHGELTNPQRRLPELSLPAAAGGGTLPLRAGGRRAPLLVLVHGPGCRECASYVASLAARRQDVEEWDGRLLVVTPAAGGDGAPLPMVVDGDGRVAEALGIGAPAVVVADQWGQLHAAEEAGDEHRFLAPEELVEWARYLAMHCPECEGEAL